MKWKNSLSGIVVLAAMLGAIALSMKFIHTPGVSAQEGEPTVVAPVSEVVVSSGVMPNPDTNFGAVISLIVDAFQGGDWIHAGAFVLMLLVWGFARIAGKFGLNIDPKWLPVINASVGMLLGVCSSLIGGKEWFDALLGGLVTSGEAALFWSLLGKRILPTGKTEIEVTEDGPVDGG